MRDKRRNCPPLLFSIVCEGGGKRRKKSFAQIYNQQSGWEMHLNYSFFFFFEREISSISYIKIEMEDEHYIDEKGLEALKWRFVT